MAVVHPIVARPARLANLPVLAFDTADALRELGRRPPAGERFDAAVDWMLHLDAARPAGEPARNAPARFRLVGDSRAGSGVADANGDGSFTFSNPAPIQGTRVIQVLVRDANGTLRGSSTTVTN